MSINHVVLEGNLTRDAEVRQTNSGGSVISMGIAVTERRKNQGTGEWESRPNYVDVTLFDNSNTKQWMVPYLVKGFKVVVDGRLHMDEWEKDGQRRTKLVVYAGNIVANWPPRDEDRRRPGDGARGRQRTYEGHDSYGGARGDQSGSYDDIPF